MASSSFDKRMTEVITTQHRNLSLLRIPNIMTIINSPSIPLNPHHPNPGSPPPISLTRPSA